MERTFLIRTFGCQMNEHDSERIGGLLLRDGMTPTEDVAEARLVVLNTCAIRENADNKLYGNLGHLKPLKDREPGAADRRGRVPRAEGPGCDPAASAVGRRRGRAPTRCRNLLELLRRSETEGPLMDVREYTEVFPSALPAARQDAFRAWVSIATGCDNACTFCIVPFVRGAQRSRSIGDVLAEVQGLVRTGVVEVTLLGQNVNTYGRDLTVAGSANAPLFARLLREVDRIDGLRRIRFTSPHPHDFTPDVIDAMASSEHVCEHIHFPLQSGSDRVLKAMRRSYRGDRYLGWLEAIRAACPASRSRPTSSSGSRARRRRTSPTRSTSWSARGSTPRSRSSTRRGPARGRPRWTEQLPKEVVQERFDRLLALQTPITAAGNRALVGRTVEVLVEGSGKRNGSTQARTRTNRIVHLAEPLAPGTFVDARITEAGAHHLFGSVAAPIAV